MKSSLPTIFPSYIKRTGLDFTAAKVVQVAQRVLVTTAIDTRESYQTLHFVKRMLCDKL